MDKNKYFEDISFAITSDKGHLGLQAGLLVKSIRDHYPESQIFNFIPETSYYELEPEIRSIFDSLTTVSLGSIPVSEYPLTALHQSFINAAKESDTQYIAALDTDTILLSKLTKPIGTDGCNLYLKPEDSGENYWTCSNSREDWQRVYSHFDQKPPDMPSNMYSSVDNSRLISPYYQGAVVITTDRDLPSKWLEMTRSAVKNDIYDYGEEWFHEQITLAVLAQNYSVGLLSNRQNHPLYARLRCPKNAELVHYLRGEHLYRHRNCTSLKGVSETHLFDKLSSPAGASDYYRVFADNVTRVVPYPHNKKINAPIRWGRNIYKKLNSI